MEVVSFEQGTSILDTAGLRARRLFRNPTVQMIEMRIAPGAELDDHAQPMDVNFYLLSGELDFRVDRENRKLVPGEMIHCPRDNQRGFTNSGCEEAVLSVVKLSGLT